MNVMQERTSAIADAPRADQSLQDLAGWLPYSFSVLANRISACLFDMYNQQYGLSVPGWRIMAVLGIHQPLSAKEVAQHTAMDQVSVSRAITQLDKLGLITRRVDKADRRKVVLTLSAKGMAARAEIVPIALALERAIVADLSNQERMALVSMMKKLMAASEQEIPSPADWHAAVQKFAAPAPLHARKLRAATP